MEWNVVDILKYRSIERKPHIKLYLNRVQFNLLAFKGIHLLGKKFLLQCCEGHYRFYMNDEEGVTIHFNKNGYALYSSQLYNYLVEHLKKKLLYIKLDGDFIYLNCK